MARCVDNVAGHFHMRVLLFVVLFVGLLPLDTLTVFAYVSINRHLIDQLQPVTSAVECNTADPQSTQRVLSAACYQMVNIVDGSYRIHGNKLRR